jgi:hypothetical protein
MHGVKGSDWLEMKNLVYLQLYMNLSELKNGCIILSMYKLSEYSLVGFFLEGVGNVLASSHRVFVHVCVENKPI